MNEETENIQWAGKNPPKVVMDRSESGDLVVNAAKMFDEDALHAMAPFPTLKEKLSRVAAHCATIQKDAFNEHQKYSYVSARAVFVRVNEALIDNRLISIPIFKIAESKDRVNASGKNEQLITVECRLQIADLDSDDFIQVTAFGSGQDWGDKAVMKAQTAGLKYAWVMALNVSMEDDPEADSQVDARMTGQPTRPKKTKEEYESTVEANKAAKYSPLAVELSDQINAALRPPEKPSKGLWPGETPEVPTTCACGAPLIKQRASKEKGGYDYWTCQLSHEAFKGDEDAKKTMAVIDAENGGQKLKHHWAKAR
jgi:hypothetical protein